MKGRHTLKFGGQFLHYDQQRFYAGNNGLLGFINFSGAFTGFAFSDFLLDMVSGKGRGGGDPNDPWTHLQNRISLFAQDDFKILRRPDAEPRAALGLHLAARREGQSAVELRSRDRPSDLREGRQHRRARALQALLQGLRAAHRRGLQRHRSPGVPRRLRHHAVHGRHRCQPSAAAEPAVLLRVGGGLRRHDRRRHERGRASPSWFQARRPAATCARTIRICARSSRSSGTCSGSIA